MVRPLPLFATALLALLPATARGQERHFLTLDEITATIIGNTMTGSRGDESYAEFFAPDGTIHGQSGDKRYTARWWLRQEDALMCFRYGDGPFEAGCTRLTLTGDQVGFVLLDGTVEPSATLVKGNPRNL